MRRDVGGDTWLYSWDLNGNLTEKTNGIDTWTYTWDTVDNRLVRVQGPAAVDVAYTYDASGRMLSRDDGTYETNFLWDGWTMTREQTGMSTTTYCIPEKLLVSFIRDGNRFDAHLDAIGSVRMVTDHNGDVVARFEPDAWGGMLASSFDNVPGGMPYSWIGGQGVRLDEASGLYYMRQRWYDAISRQFISRDPLGVAGGHNLYSYSDNSPIVLTDSHGLWPPGTGTAPPGSPPITLPSAPFNPPPPSAPPAALPAAGAQAARLTVGSALTLAQLAYWGYRAGKTGIQAMEAYNEAAEAEMQGDRRAEQIRRERLKNGGSKSAGADSSSSSGGSGSGTGGDGPGGGDSCREGYENDLEYCTYCFPRGALQDRCLNNAFREFLRCKNNPCGKKIKLPMPPTNWKDKTFRFGLCRNYKTGGAP